MGILLRTHREVMGLGVKELPPHYQYAVYASHDQKTLHFVVFYKKRFWQRRLHVASLSKPLSESDTAVTVINELAKSAWMLS